MCVVGEVFFLYGTHDYSFDSGDLETLPYYKLDQVSILTALKGRHLCIYVICRTVPFCMAQVGLPDRGSPRVSFGTG